MRVTLFIARLGIGGAEAQFSRLAIELAKLGHQVQVVTILSGGRYWDILSKEPDVELTAFFDSSADLPCVKFWHLMLAPWSLKLAISRFKPDVVYSALEVGNLVAALARKILGKGCLVWGIRCVNVVHSSRMALIVKMLAWMSRSPNGAISNSNAALEYYRTLGFKVDKWQVVPNGIDTTYFQPMSVNRQRIRDDWGILSNAILVGSVNRIVPMKNYPMLIEAAAILKEKFSNVFFVFVGKGEVHYVKQLQGMVREYGVEDRIVWAGECEDMPSVYSALDIYCTPSSGEGFSNSLAEAMACGLPCLATDAGDNSFVLGDLFETTPNDNTEVFAQELASLIEQKPKLPFMPARHHIEKKFSIVNMVTKTERIFVSLLS